jgi:hypothetical protein
MARAIYADPDIFVLDNVLDGVNV